MLKERERSENVYIAGIRESGEDDKGEKGSKGGEGRSNIVLDKRKKGEIAVVRGVKAVVVKGKGILINNRGIREFLQARS